MDIRFDSPWVLLLLAILPLAAAWLWPARMRGGAVGVGSAATMMPAGATWRTRLEPLLAVLRIVALAALVLALARPQRAVAATSEDSEGIDIVLAFDVSSSMTQQFGGNRTRIDAAKQVLTDFLRARQNDRVGLVAFQGSALTFSPLTTDYAALEQSVQNADGINLADGTAIGVALGESVNVLRSSNAASRIIILMTDGENNAGAVEPLAAARIAERLGARVYTVGVVGEGIRSPRSTVNVDEESLRRMAEITGGTYSRAEDEATLGDIYTRIDELEKSRFAGDELERFGDIAPYFLAAAASAIALELALRSTLFRRLA